MRCEQPINRVCMLPQQQVLQQTLLAVLRQEGKLISSRCGSLKRMGVVPCLQQTAPSIPLFRTFPCWSKCAAYLYCMGLWAA